MKSLIYLVLIFLCCCFYSCRKDEPLPPLNELPPCGITEITSIPFDGLSFGNGMVKTFDNYGLVTSVATAIGVIFDDADSVYYNMKWRQGPATSVIAEIAVTRKSFTGAVSPPLVLQETTNYTIQAIFSKLHGRLLAISCTDAPAGDAVNKSFKLTYNAEGKLTDFGDIKLDYDELGNIVRVPSRGTGGSTAMIYEYNVSFKSPGRQLYLGSGYNVNELYNLAEICSWIPVEPVYVRTRDLISWTNNNPDDYIAGRKDYSDQEFGDEKLLSFVVDGTYNMSTFWLCRAGPVE
jgi:hypothetical protein